MHSWASERPSTLGDVWRSQWNTAGLSTALGVKEDPLREANAEMRDALQRETGKGFETIAEAVTGQAGLLRFR